MPHSHRYERRRKLEVMYNSNKRLFEYAEALRQEAVAQNKPEIADTLANIMVKCMDIRKELDTLSKPFTGYPLAMIVGRSNWSKSES